MCVCVCVNVCARTRAFVKGIFRIVISLFLTEVI